MTDGYVPTPSEVALNCVKQLFARREPKPDDRILYPGMGDGPFSVAVRDYCESRGLPVPDGIGIELDGERASRARDQVTDRVEVINGDFLTPDVRSRLGEFEYIVGNPPYVSIEYIDETDKEDYRDRFDVATGRFDLYMLFFEAALDHLADDGRLVFITPEKFEYVQSAAALRQLLSSRHIVEIDHLPEDVFPNHAAYPVATTVDETSPGETRVSRRDGSTGRVRLPASGESWAEHVRQSVPDPVDSPVTLSEISKRVSSGPETACDDIFVDAPDVFPDAVIEQWGHPAIGGSEVELGKDARDVWEGEVTVCPYREDGSLIELDSAPNYREWAEQYRDRLEDRWCVEEDGVPWHAWHIDPPFPQMAEPKLICPDVSERPKFCIDRGGEFVPMHSTYYIVPEHHVEIDELAEYLNSEPVTRWFDANCQRARGGYMRVQSSVLSEVPVPKRFAKSYQSTLF